MAVVQYTFTHKQYIEQHNRHKEYIQQYNLERVRTVPGICVVYPGICLTTEEKAIRLLYSDESVCVPNSDVREGFIAPK